MVSERRRTASDEQAQGSSTGGRTKRAGIRFNAEKVIPLSDNSMVEATPPGKFSQWRAKRAQMAESIRDGSTETNSVAILNPHRSPKKKRRLRRWGYLLTICLVLALLFIGLVFYTPLLAIRTVTVEGTSILQKTDVEQRLSPLQGLPLTRVSSQSVSELIGESHIVRGVSIEARPPHELVVIVQERVPVAVIKDAGSYQLVDAEGVQLGNVDSVESAGVPLIDGGADILNSNVYTTVASVLEALPADLLVRVKEAKADSASTISLTMNDGVQVVWGSSSDNEFKAKVLSELMSAVGEDGSVSTYDVSSPTVPTTK